MAAIHWILGTILLTTFTGTLQDDKAANEDYEYDDDYYDDPEPLNDVNKEAVSAANNLQAPQDLETKVAKNYRVSKALRDEQLTTVKPLARYEVTELVIDVPDDSSRGPIHTNFTVHRPLNIAGEANNTAFVKNANDVGDEVINTILTPSNKYLPAKTDRPRKNMDGRSVHDYINKGKKNYFEILPFESEFDDESHEKYEHHHELDEFDFKEDKEVKNIKDYFHDVKKDIANGFKSDFDKHKDIHDSLHKIVAGPALFLSKLHKKGEELANKFHKAVSKHKFHEEDDDEYEYDYS